MMALEGGGVDGVEAAALMALMAAALMAGRRRR